MADDLKNKTVKGVSWSFVEQILTRGANFVIGIILARLLTPTDYGLVGMLAIFIAIAQLFIDGGLTSALIRQKNPSNEDFSTVYIVNMTLSVVFYFLLFFSAPLIADFYDQPLLKPLMRVVAISLVIGPLASVQNTLLTIRVDFKTKTIISIINALVSGAVGIYCAFKGLGPWALIAQTLSSTIVSTILALVFVHWMPRLVFSINSFKRLFSYSSRLLAASIISTIYDNAYPMVIGKRYLASDVGLYTRANQFPGIVNATFTSAMNRVAFPILSQIQDDDERLLNVYEKYIQVFCFLTFPTLMVLSGCARPLVSLLLTDKWIACVPLMQIICFSLIPNGMIQINLNLLYVKGRSDLVLRMEIIKKLIMFSVLLISMFFGLRAICYAMVFNALVDLYFSSFYTKRILGYSLIQQLKAIYPYFLLSLVLLAEALLATHYISNRWIAILVPMIVCPLTYWGLNHLLNLYAYREGMGMIKARFKKTPPADSQ